MEMSESELKSLLEEAYKQGSLGVAEFAGEYASKALEVVLESKTNSLLSNYVLTATNACSLNHIQNIDATYYFQDADILTIVASDQIEKEKNG